MANHKETLEGCVIEITNEKTLTINGKEIDYEQDVTQNKWSTKYLPYTKFNSLLEMARAIVKDTVEFSTAHQ